MFDILEIKAIQLPLTVQGKLFDLIQPHDIYGDFQLMQYVLKFNKDIIVFLYTVPLLNYPKRSSSMDRGVESTNQSEALKKL